MAEQRERSVAGWAWIVVQIVGAAFFFIYALYDGLQGPKGGRLHFGLFWLFASGLFWLMSQYPPTAKKAYAMQMEWYRKVYSEEQFRKNGLYPTIATAVLGVFFVIAGLI